MKNALATIIIALSLVACATQDDTTPDAVTAPDPGRWVQQCGIPPRLGTYSVSFTASDPKLAQVPLDQWLVHVQWSADVDAWAACVDSTRF